MKKMMYLATALLVLVGCNKDNSVQNTPDDVVIIKGVIKHSKTPKMIAAQPNWEQEVEFNMLWEANDKILIYEPMSEAYEEYKLIDGAGTRTATFWGHSLPEAQEYKVAYGYDPRDYDPYGYRETPLTVTVPYIEGNYRPFAYGSMDPMTKEFVISGYGPVLGMPLKGTSKLTKIEVECAPDEHSDPFLIYIMPFAGGLQLNMDEATKVFFPLYVLENMTAPNTVYVKFYNADGLILSKQFSGPSADLQDNLVSYFSDLNVDEQQY